MSARKPDPAVIAWDRLEAADKAHSAAYDARDEARARVSDSKLLIPVDAAEVRAMWEWRAAMKAMGETRATTIAGVISKLKIIEIEIRDGRTGFGEAIIASAIADLSRIGRRGR